MKILKRLTLQDLKMHKKRTIVTVVGIILSTSLITGVAAIASSFRATYIDYQIAQTGDYHYWFSNVPASDLTYFENNRNIAKISLIKDAGYSTLPRGTTEIKKYFQFISGRPSDFSSLAFTLTEGRFPEKRS
jgi:putative ABC transport system permease protein